MIICNPAMSFSPICPHCDDDSSVFQLDESEPETFACDWCGAVTSDNGATWSEPAVPEVCPGCGSPNFGPPRLDHDAETADFECFSCGVTFNEPATGSEGIEHG